MIGGEGGSLSEYREVAFAPTCRRCLSLIDRHFPEPRADGRLQIVANLAADLVIEHGCSEIYQVPGDQQATLRKAVRSLVKQRSGFGCRTYLSDGTVHIVCDAIFDLHSLQYQSAAMEVVSNVLFGDGQPGPVRLPDWKLSWEAWDVNLD
jgi:hypothetical protein